MQARKRPTEELPTFEEMTATSAIVTFTEKSVRALLDDLYDARIGQVEVRSKWQGAEPIEIREIEEIDPETQKAKTVRLFVYPVVQPRGHFLRDSFPDGEGPWLKLWQDMLWAIPRGIPKTRLPFQQRAEGKPCEEGGRAWESLVKAGAARNKGQFYTADVSSALWLGAQATNAEGIPFQGRAEQNFLLHFWQLVVLIFVPQRIDIDGSSEFAGYVLAIPEVANLEEFCAEYPLMLQSLSADVRGYRPAEAVIDLPAEGALAFIDHLARLAERMADATQIKYSVSAVEFMHLIKIGNNVKSSASGRVSPNPRLLREYRQITGAPGKPAPYRNPLFRRGLLQALLNDECWFEPMDPILAQHPWPFFVRSEQSPRKLPWFWQDAANRFAAVTIEYEETSTEEPMTNADSSSPKTDTLLAILIYRLVRNYVNQKTEEKSDIKWENFKDKKIKDEKTGKETVDVPQKYRETREKVASGTFLEMRSRREQAFVDHFTATFCYVKQYLSEDDFQVVAQALLYEPENVKTLTLLALSANS
jgi:CRISPR-associated protein Cmx8